MAIEVDSESIIKLSSNRELLKELKSFKPEEIKSSNVKDDVIFSKANNCDNVWKYLVMCFETPRPSGSLTEITEKITNLAKNLNGVECKVDEVGNILLCKQSKRGDDVPTVCVQAHLDIVASKNEDVEHNFITEGVKCEVVDGWVKAKGTTLGADNGIGVAAGLALLEEDDEHFPNIEILLTVEEESDMSGAENLKSDFMKATTLVNVDSEEENAVCVGCAGGVEKKFTFDVLPVEVDQGYTALSIQIRGLVGGHSGIDIDKKGANAIKIIGKALQSLSTPALRLCHWKGGTAVNTIPRECDCVVTLPECDSESFCENLKKYIDDSFKQEFKESDPDASCVVKKIESSCLDYKFCLSESATKKALDLVNSLPHGVLNMNEEAKEMVETSVNFSYVDLSIQQKKDSYEFMNHLFWRSSKDAVINEVAKNAEDLAKEKNVNISEDIAFFPGWQPNIQNSKGLDSVIHCHENLFGNKPRVYAVHAGLECGFIKRSYPDLDCVSIGPLVLGAHTPEERLCIPSVPRFYKLLCSTLRYLATKR